MFICALEVRGRAARDPHFFLNPGAANIECTEGPEKLQRPEARDARVHRGLENLHKPETLNTAASLQIQNSTACVNRQTHYTSVGQEEQRDQATSGRFTDFVQ